MSSRGLLWNFVGVKSTVTVDFIGTNSGAVFGNHWGKTNSNCWFYPSDFLRQYKFGWWPQVLLLLVLPYKTNRGCTVDFLGKFSCSESSNLRDLALGIRSGTPLWNQKCSMRLRSYTNQNLKCDKFFSSWAEMQSKNT